MTNRRGIALTIVIVIIVAVSAVSAAALSLGYNQRLLARHAVAGRTQAYYFARAGIVDAQETIRRDEEGRFGDPDFDPAPYEIDVDGDLAADVTVDIGRRSPETGYRTIRSTGRS